MPGLSLIHESCGLCGQSFDVDRSAIESDELALFGAAQYAWCLFCRREVRGPWTPDYRARWDAAMRERQKGKDSEGTPIGLSMRNRHGTRGQFRLRFEDGSYHVSLQIADGSVTIGEFVGLREAMAAYRAFADRLRASGFADVLSRL